MATGYQWRDVTAMASSPTVWRHRSELQRGHHDPGPQGRRVLAQETRAVFLEVECPDPGSLSIQGAVRHEQFTDFGIESTTPKVALRWEAMEGLALRASWGESFLAPTPVQARPFIPNELCGEAFSGNDPFFNASLIGSSTCRPVTRTCVRRLPSSETSVSPTKASKT
jgi:iron complex outermembrane receptor protein